MPIVNTRAKYMYVQVVSWYISKSVFLHSAAIHLVGIAGKMKEKKSFFETYKPTYMYFARVFTLSIAGKFARSMLDRGKLCLD